MGDQEINAQKVIYLQQKVKDYEARLFTQTFKYNPANYDYEATKVFEREVIYELKEENERLKEFINQKKVLKPTTDKNNLELSRAELEIKEAFDEELDEVQGRLAVFKNKL